MKNPLYFPGLCGIAIFAAIFISDSPDASAQEKVKTRTLFTEATDLIPFEKVSRRKWDNPLIADLDQDGHMDILITEHAHKASIFWNNGGKFSEPQDVIPGDTHGVTAGDFDQDGRMDLIFYNGGGGGNNPRFPVIFHVNRDRSIEKGGELDHLEPSRGRAAKLLDADNNGSLDLVLTAFPLKEQKNGANHLCKNNGEGGFDFVNYLPRAKWMGFKVLITDFDSDNIADLIFYGGDNMVAARGGQKMNFSDVSKKVLGDLRDTKFASSIVEIDFDNDGDFDLFITRVDHQFASKTYFDCDACRFAFFSRRQKMEYEDLKITGDLRVENLQMAYPHFDVFTGKEKKQLEFETDKHGGKTFTLKSEEAPGWPDELSAKGFYIGHLGDGLWRLGGETTSPTAAVIHNVKSHPPTTEIQKMPALLLENREGTFVDVSAQIGINLPNQTTSSAVGDFNNDGWTDLFVVLQGSPASPTEQALYLNQGGKFFMKVTDHGLVSSELGSTGGGAEPIDYDEDGDLDLILANERGRWRLFTNDGLAASDHNYLTVKVGSSPSGKATALGAVLTLKADGKIFKRVVGATSAAFSRSANNHLHLGLGPIKKIDQATLRWTNGETANLKIDKLNQSIKVGKFQ